MHGEETALPRAGRGGCFMRSSYSRSWRTLAPSPSATFFGEIISKTIFTKNVVVTGSRCLLLCNKVCFNGAHFQMCCLDSRHLPGPLRSRGSSQPPSRARCPHPGGSTFPEHCFPFFFFFFFPAQLSPSLAAVLGPAFCFWRRSARRVTEHRLVQQCMRKRWAMLG